jgi:hypothetical protein
MIKVKLENETFELRNEANEITLKEFNKIYTILNSQTLGKLEQYCEVFKTLGLPEAIIYDMENESFIELIKSFNAMEISSELPVKSIEIKGYNYVAYSGDEFKFKTKDLIEIEKCAKRGIDNFPSYILSIIFKREDLSVNEHYEQSHLNLKAKLFEENVNADFAIPYITLVAKRTLKSLEDAK